MFRWGRLRDWFLPALIHLDPMVAIAYSVAMDEASPHEGLTATRNALVSDAFKAVTAFHLVDLPQAAPVGVTRAGR